MPSLFSSNVITLMLASFSYLLDGFCIYIHIYLSVNIHTHTQHIHAYMHTVGQNHQVNVKRKHTHTHTHIIEKIDLKRKFPIFLSPELIIHPSLPKLCHFVQYRGRNICILRTKEMRERLISCSCMYKIPPIFFVVIVISILLTLVHSCFCVLYARVICSFGSTSLDHKLLSSERQSKVLFGKKRRN